jgi:hypothetical protein
VLRLGWEDCIDVQLIREDKWLDHAEKCVKWVGCSVHVGSEMSKSREFVVRGSWF